jgi:hypothetical protein
MARNYTAIIKGLLTKAEDKGATEEERESFRKGAFELAAKWGIDIAVARTYNPQPQDAIVERVFVVARPYTQKRILAGVIYRSRGAFMLQEGTNGMIAIGYESDLEMAKMLYESVVVQADLAAVAKFRPERDGVWRTFRRGFFNGFARAIGDRLEEAEKKAISDEGDQVGTALALRDRDDKVDAWAKIKYPKTRKGRRIRSSKAYTAYLGGREAGLEADLGLDERIGATTREGLN